MDAPTGRLTVSAMLPAALGVKPVAPPAPTAVNVAPASVAGKLSTTLAPTTLLGPELLTTIVYVTGVPGIAVVFPSVLVMTRSAWGVRLSPSVEVLLPGVGSVVPGGGV